jgi:glycerate kinase
MSALRVGEALTAGLLEAGAPQPDVCAVERTPPPGEGARELLDGVRFDARMRGARAVILAVASLEEGTLAGSLAFEAATRARQGGVPCYAVTAANHLDAFDVRILDLQAVLEAGTPAALTGAGRRLATIL